MLALLFAFFFAPHAQAYPEFIGHGYTSCMTCHWNGNGGGGLNDYGRALFASEIAARPWGTNNDEEMAAWSGFLGKVPMPFWFKPGYKFRRLYNEINPGSAQKIARYYGMENDFNLASFTGSEMTFGFVGTISLVNDPKFAAPNRRIDNSSLMMREYYLRYQMNEHMWWYAGFMDKAYGIHVVDHTAVNRSEIRLGQNDQVHGVEFQFQNEHNEFFVQPFIGNLHLDAAHQTKGATAMYEYEPHEKVRYGASARYEKSTAEKIGTAAVHARVGVGNGHAMLSEIGFKKDQLAGALETTGAYGYLEFNYQVVRGLNFQSILQYDKTDFSSHVPDTNQWGLGIVYFPLQRVEWRMQALQQRVAQDNNVRDDQWVVQAQLHLSL